MKTFDVFIIGTGVAGTIIAKKCADSGLKVGITDDLPYGGTCALRGCDPKKILIDATDARDFAMRLNEKGIDNPPTVNWKDLMAFKQTFTDPVPGDKEKMFAHKGITKLHGQASFISKNQLQINDEIIEAEKIVIATGASPRKLDIPGGEYAITSTDFLNLDKLPSSMLFVGGGYIAFELAHVAARCGVEVSIVDMEKSPLVNFEGDLVEHLVKASRDLGIKVFFDTKVTAIEKQAHGFSVKGLSQGKEQKFESAMVVNASGRVPAIAALKLEKAHIKFTSKGIEVNKYLQSVSNPHVYAAGDVAATHGMPLTPSASLEGHITASNIIDGNNKIPDYTGMPTTVFTLPPLAMVGLTEKAAREKNLKFSLHYNHVPGWYNARRLNVEAYAYKVLVEEKTNKILGAHLLAPHAQETINLFALAIKTGIKADELKKMPFVFPSLASDISYMTG